ncbi:hypothetical protein [Burkholderia pseudomallei]|uniref:hypothetical protein n=1 Tax=Burkholderia pseudomallei TaxID=28450 RepID=UPI000A848EF1|nr:hypothetical protein [Burkholderia pseudomallei]
MDGPNQRIDQFVEERLKQIDVSLTPAERRAAERFVPYFRWATDDELRELLQLLKRHAAGEMDTNDTARAAAICEQIAARLVAAGEGWHALYPDDAR